jgi:aryl-alcohol dehydrogenase-like predicted oxidoreductase
VIDRLVLGTAKWGSEVERKSAFQLLDDFSAAGGRFIDAATNYPIDRNLDNHGLANKYILEWIELNPKIKLEVFIKIGSKNNSGSPEHDLSAKSLEKEIKLLQNTFGDNLSGLGVHWDNRGDDLIEEIRETIELFRSTHENGFRIGISGIENKKAYFETASDLVDLWEIQVKETHNNSGIRETYLPFFPRAKYLAYGISTGFELEVQNQKKNSIQRIHRSIEISKESFYQKTIKTMLRDDKIYRVIIGPRKNEQLTSILKWATEVL